MTGPPSVAVSAAAISAVYGLGYAVTESGITRCTTFFPQSHVAGLPDEVISTQATSLAVVSGATGSWQDFVAATRFALTAATHPKQTR